jgi:hypothetical protein
MNYRKWVREQLAERKDKAKAVMEEAKEAAVWRAHTVGKFGYCDAHGMAIFKNFVSKLNLRDIAFDAWYEWEV